jgi:hypothetical protein
MRLGSSDSHEENLEFFATGLALYLRTRSAATEAAALTFQAKRLLTGYRQQPCNPEHLVIQAFPTL